MEGEKKNHMSSIVKGAGDTVTEEGSLDQNCTQSLQKETSC